MILNDTEGRNDRYFALCHRNKNIWGPFIVEVRPIVSATKMYYTMAILNKGSIGMILFKYGIPSLTVSVSDIKNLMWRHFVDVSYDKL